MQCYAVLASDLLRWKIIRRNVCTAVAVTVNSDFTLLAERLPSVQRQPLSPSKLVLGRLAK